LKGLAVLYFFTTLGHQHIKKHSLAGQSILQMPTMQQGGIVDKHFFDTKLKQENDYNRQLFRQSLHTPKQLVKSCCFGSK
jgi:hypothetical protein